MGGEGVIWMGLLLGIIWYSCKEGIVLLSKPDTIVDIARSKLAQDERLFSCSCSLAFMVGLTAA